LQPVVWFNPDKIIWNSSHKTKREYAEERNIKRKRWAQYCCKRPNCYFIETDVSWLLSGVREEFEKQLKKLLEDNGVKCNKLPEKELLENVYRKHSNKLFKLFVQFIQKCRKKGYSPDQIKEKRDQYKTDNEKENAFLKVAPEIYEKYEISLVKKDRLDFDKLLNLAIEKIKSSQGDCLICDPKNNVNIRVNGLEYILIDEFQDFSKQFYDLIAAIREVNPKVKLFCVGDDWQAIYGFAGSDLEYYDGFQKDYPNSSQRDILVNYRSDTTIVEAGNKLMEGKGEKGQSSSGEDGTVEIVNIDDYDIEGRDNQKSEKQYQDDEKYIKACEVTIRGKDGEERKIIDFGTARYLKAIHELLRKNLKFLSEANKTCFLLLRRNRFGCFENCGKFKDSLPRIFSEEEIKKIGKNRFEKNIHVLTAHKAKGKEADIVIIMPCNTRSFPLIHPDNRLFGIFGESDKKSMEEERRLFYVALTRAKHKLYLLAEEEEKSIFLKDAVLL
jgi:DNA helicase IV